MALAFTAASLQYLSFPSALATVPFTFSCWYKPTNNTGNQQFITICPTTTAHDWLAVGGSSGKGSTSQSDPSNTVTIVSSNTMTAGSWNHIVGVVPTTVACYIYVNNVLSFQTLGTATFPVNLAQTLIGVFSNIGVLSQYANGAIAYPTLWNNLVISTPQVNFLWNNGTGLDPRTVQYSFLSSFLPLASGGLTDFITGTPWTAHAGPTATGDPFALIPGAQVTTGAATSIIGSSATLNGTIFLESSPITAVGFNYGPTTGYGSVVQKTGSFQLGGFSLSISGLTPGNTYHWQAFATGISGTGVGADNSFVAGSGTTPPFSRGEVLFNGSQLSTGTTATGSIANLTDADNTTTWTTTGIATAGVDAGAVTQLTRIRFTAQPTAEDLVLGNFAQASTTDSTFVANTTAVYVWPASGTIGIPDLTVIRPNTGTLMNEVDVSLSGSYYRYYQVSTDPVNQVWSMADLDFIGFWTSGVNARPVAPVITPPNGNYDLPTILRISSISTSASIYYTLDGTTPSAASKLYTAPFVVTTNTIVKAIAIDSGLTTPSSRVTTGYFVIPSMLWTHQFFYDNRGYSTKGSPGSIFKDPVSGYWYYYALDQDTHSLTNNQLGTNSWRSPDLRNWTFTGNICGSAIGSQIFFDYRTIRLKMFYSPVTKTYAAWMEGSDVQGLRIFTSPFPDGRQVWTFIGSFNAGNALNDGFLTGTSQAPGDLGFFQDPVTGNQYVIYNYNINALTAFSQLDPNLGYANTLGPSFCRSYSNFQREGWSMMYNQGTYYLMHSAFGTPPDNYAVNTYLTGSSPIGPFTGSTNPFQPPVGTPVLPFGNPQTPSILNAYCGQSYQFINITGRNAWIWMGGDTFPLNSDDPYLNGFLFTPVIFTSPTTFTLSWYSGKWMDGTDISPWSLDVIFPTISGAPLNVSNFIIKGNNVTWTNNEPLAAAVYFDSASDANFVHGVASEVLPDGTNSFTISVPNNYYRIRTVNANGTSIQSIQAVAISVTGLYVILSVFGCYDVRPLITGIDYASSIFEVISGPYTDPGVAFQALWNFLQTVPFPFTDTLPLPAPGPFTTT